MGAERVLAAMRWHLASHPHKGLGVCLSAQLEGRLFPEFASAPLYKECNWVLKKQKRCAVTPLSHCLCSSPNSYLLIDCIRGQFSCHPFMRQPFAVMI